MVIWFPQIGRHDAKPTPAVKPLFYWVSGCAALECPMPQVPSADPNDVGSIDAILKCLYEVISGPAGQERNWDRYRSLFLAEARSILAVALSRRRALVVRLGDVEHRTGLNITILTATSTPAADRSTRAPARG